MDKVVSKKANDFCRHPVYDRWEANREGIVRHVENKKDIGGLTNSGYLRITVYDQDIRKKIFKAQIYF